MITTTVLEAREKAMQTLQYELCAYVLKEETKSPSDFFYNSDSLTESTLIESLAAPLNEICARYTVPHLALSDEKPFTFKAFDALWYYADPGMISLMAYAVRMTNDRLDARSKKTAWVNLFNPTALTEILYTADAQQVHLFDKQKVDEIQWKMFFVLSGACYACYATDNFRREDVREFRGELLYLNWTLLEWFFTCELGAESPPSKGPSPRDFIDLNLFRRLTLNTKASLAGYLTMPVFSGR